MARPIIKLDGVKKTFGQGASRTDVLRGVSMSIDEGEMVALVGQSGSGKSTLLNVIGGLDRPDAGTVVIAGEETTKKSDRELSRLRNERIGFVFQAFHLLDHLSVQDNVLLPSYFGPSLGSDPVERALEALERVGMKELASRRPTELSGGQKQRVAIARALFNRPTILLCDEPTGNLDSETGRQVIQFFRELNENDRTTLLIVTHEERVSVAARRVIRIVDGLIVAEDGSAAAEQEAC